MIEALAAWQVKRPFQKRIVFQPFFFGGGVYRLPKTCRSCAWIKNSFVKSLTCVPVFFRNQLLFEHCFFFDGFFVVCIFLSPKKCGRFHIGNFEYHIFQVAGVWFNHHLVFGVSWRIFQLTIKRRSRCPTWWSLSKSLESHGTLGLWGKNLGWLGVFWCFTHPKTNKSPLKIGRDPKGNVFSNHWFSGGSLLVSEEGRTWHAVRIRRKLARHTWPTGWGSNVTSQIYEKIGVEILGWHYPGLSNFRVQLPRNTTHSENWLEIWVILWEDNNIYNMKQQMKSINKEDRLDIWS